LSHSWLGSEFIVDDLPQVVTSRAFAEDVSELLVAQGYEIAPEQVQYGMEAEVLHRLVTIDVTADQPQQAEAMARGAVEALQVNGLRYWDRASGEDNGLSIAVLTPATPAASLQGTSQLVLEVGLRVALALAAAIGIAFLWYYLDDTVRDQRQAEAWIGMPVVGVIPKE
jgi:capsular polysaccharide biosynthesis protein